MLKIAINGFGRMGKCLLREYYNRNISSFQIAVINSNKLTPENASYMTKYDSTHGRFLHNIQHNNSEIVVNDMPITITSESSIEKLRWNNIDIVVECTGRYSKAEEAMIHINQGADKVIVSAPSQGADATVVLGVNDDDIKEDSKIISMGSCTTNCLAPIAFVIENTFGIKSGFMTTTHAYTNDQRLIDSRHDKDARRGRAAATSIIPTSTGAAKNIGIVIPSLKGKIDGAAVRVPVHNVSMIDFSFCTQRQVTKDDLHAAISKYAQQHPNIIAINDEQLVSSDFCGRRESSIVDFTQTKILHSHVTNSTQTRQSHEDSQNHCRIVSWYDNEIGFVNRILDLCERFANS